MAEFNGDVLGLNPREKHFVYVCEIPFDVYATQVDGYQFRGDDDENAPRVLKIGRTKNEGDKVRLLRNRLYYAFSSSKNLCFDNIRDHSFYVRQHQSNLDARYPCPGNEQVGGGGNDENFAGIVGLIMLTENEDSEKAEENVRRRLGLPVDFNPFEQHNIRLGIDNGNFTKNEHIIVSKRVLYDLRTFFSGQHAEHITASYADFNAVADIWGEDYFRLDPGTYFIDLTSRNDTDPGLPHQECKPVLVVPQHNEGETKDDDDDADDDTDDDDADDDTDDTDDADDVVTKLLISNIKLGKDLTRMNRVLSQTEDDRDNLNQRLEQAREALQQVLINL